MKYRIIYNKLWRCKYLEMFAIINTNLKGVFVSNNKVECVDRQSWTYSHGNLAILIIIK